MATKAPKTRGIEVKAKPQDYEGDYKFFRNTKTNRDWKAKLVVNEVSTIEGGAPSQLGVTVTVSPVDNSGKTVTEDSKPIVIDSWTHTFNSVEMAEEGFDPEQRILDIIEERIDVGEARMAGVDKVRNLAKNWSK